MATSVLPRSGLKVDPDNPRSIDGDPPPIDVAMETSIRPLLDLVDRLRSHGIEDELSLPQIAVMGDQSSGKSSVLEALSGVQFPRGSGLVTRCPVQLIMKQSNAGSPWKAKAHIAWHNPARKAAVASSSSINSIKEKADEINIQSESELAGVMSSLMELSCTSAPNGFSSDSVVIEIESPSSPDLTLIDLPGIVRTAVKGQSGEVISQVNGMIDTHLTQERTIILAIVPANQDIATVDILERARRVDPEGLRTIGVLTKPDLVGPGNEEEVLEVLYNKRKPLSLGYVMVRCRTQKELSEGATMAGAQKAESDFFRTHPVFKKLCHDEKKRMGIGTLTSQCVNLLVKRIKDALPQMKWELQEKLLCVENELKPLPDIIHKDHTSRIRAMVQIITNICRLLRASIAGEYRDPLLNSLPELRIRSSVDRYFRSLQKGIAEIEAGFDHPNFPHDLQEQLREHRGREVCGIVNSQFFYIFMLKQIEQFRPIVERMRNDIFLSVLGVASEVVRLAAPQYPRAVERIGRKVEECIHEVGDLIEPELDSMFEKERNPFTENAELEEAVNQMRFEVLLEAGDKPRPPGQSNTGSTFKDSQFAPQGINQLQDWVTMHVGQWYRNSHGANPTSKVEDMSTILQAYWRVTSKRLCENACMLLETTFLSGVVDSLEFRLLAYSQELEKEGLEDMFVEDRAVAQKRQMLEGRKERLRAGLLDISDAFPECVAVSKRVHTNSYGGKSVVGSGGSNNNTRLNDQLMNKNVSTGSSSPHVISGLKRPPSLVSHDSFVFGEKSEPETKTDKLSDWPLVKLNPPVTLDAPNAAERLLTHGGLFHWLGTGRGTHAFENPHDRGDVSVTCRGIITGDIRMLVHAQGGSDSHSLSELVFDQWVCIDVGVDRMLSPTHIALRFVLTFDMIMPAAQEWFLHVTNIPWILYLQKSREILNNPTF